MAAIRKSPVPCGDDDETALAALQLALRAAKQDQRVRADMDAGRLAEWVQLLLDGFAAKVTIVTNSTPNRKQKYSTNRSLSCSAFDQLNPQNAVILFINFGTRAVSHQQMWTVVPCQRRTR